MKFSKNWLQQWVDTPLTVEKLQQQLTMAGHEIDSIEPVAGEFSGVIVAEVISAVPHPNADRLRLCRVNTGNSEINIVCGGKNVRAGLKVPLAIVGAKLPNDFKIRKSKIRGEESNGMICSEIELGLAETSDGIMELLDSAPIGEDLREYLQLDDLSIDVDLTPNRGDCLSILGLARDLSAVNQTKLIDKPHKAVAANSDVTFAVKISAKEACPRYVGRVIKGINKQAQTPMWLQEALRRSGLRPISAVVDVTNYVMLELGQPLHAFDLQKLTGGIEVRFAKAKENLMLLNGDKVNLNDKTLLIADGNGPLALAGIMGGEASSCDEQTTDIFLESAFFSPQAVAGRARKYGLHTDSSHRFERGVDPNLQIRAAERATELLLQVVGGEAGVLINQKSEAHLPKDKNIFLKKNKVAKLLGVELADEAIENILLSLHMQLETVKEGWQVTVPSYRFDISLDVDLIEELVRLYGYNKIPLNYPDAPMAALPYAETQVSVEQLRDCLQSLAYQEIYSYSFVDPKLQAVLDPNNEALLLANPIAPEMAAMRTSLWSGLLQTVLHNQNRQQKRLRLFEIGQRFLQKDKDLKQQQMLAGVITDTALPLQWAEPSRVIDFFDIKGDMEQLFHIGGNETAYAIEKAEHSALHPGQSAKILCEGQEVGWIGALHPQLQQQLKLNGPIYLFEIALEALTQGQLPAFGSISKFPSIRRDLALIVDDAISAAQLKQTTESAAGELLQDFCIFDMFTGSNVPEGKKSIAVGLTLQHQERTLVDDEVNELMSRVMLALRENFQASLRE